MSSTLDLPEEQIELPLLPLRDVVVFPHMVIPLFVGRPKSIKALESAMEAGKSILLVAQKSAAKDEPSAEDLYDLGCIANILQMLKLPDGTVKVLVEGVQRARVLSVEDLRTLFVAKAQPLPAAEAPDNEVEAMRRAIISQFDQYVKLNKKIPPEILSSLSGIEDPGRLADTIAAHLPLKLEQKQEILEMFDAGRRLERLLNQLETELDILQVEKRIRGRVKRQMEKSQREYYLNEQVKAIQKELGEGEEGADIDEMEKKIKAARMSKEAGTTFLQPGGFAKSVPTLGFVGSGDGHDGHAGLAWKGPHYPTGGLVAVLAEAFGMRVVFHDIVKKLALGLARPEPDLERLLEECDFVSLHVPLTPETSITGLPQARRSFVEKVGGRGLLSAEGADALHEAGDAPPEQPCRQSAHGGLDFRQLRHRSASAASRGCPGASAGLEDRTQFPGRAPLSA